MILARLQKGLDLLFDVLQPTMKGLAILFRETRLVSICDLLLCVQARALIKESEALLTVALA